MKDDICNGPQLSYVVESPITYLNYQVDANAGPSILTKEAMVHINKIDSPVPGCYAYRVYLHCYLPLFKKLSPKIKICVSAQKTDIKDVQVNEKLKGEPLSKQLPGRSILLQYLNKRQGKVPYGLYGGSFYYLVPFDHPHHPEQSDAVPLIQVQLENIDPETTRGTVTTVKDGAMG